MCETCLKPPSEGGFRYGFDGESMTLALIKWIGGKRRLAKRIIKMMPQHKSYIEPFGGGAYVLLNKPQRKGILEVYNDLNRDLVNLFHVVKHKPHELIKELEMLLHSRYLFETWRTEVIPSWGGQPLTELGDVSRAAKFHFVITTAFGGKNDSPNFGYAVECDGGFGIDRTPKALRARFLRIYSRLKRVIIECDDFQKVIERYDHQNALFYCDPPYYSREWYSAEFAKKDHKRLYDTLSNIEGKFILSYNDCQWVRDIYSDYVVREVDMIYGLSRNRESSVKNVRVKELLICNFKIAKQTTL